MAKVTAALVKELRERTGAGMMDCKKALVATDGNVDAAIDYMRKNGLAKAAKKAGRVTAEGVLSSAKADGKAVLVEVNCETDFVARDKSFNEFCNQVAELALQKDITDVEKLKAEIYPGSSETVDLTLKNLIAKIGENMSIRRIFFYQGENLGLYVHTNKLIAALVDMKGGNPEFARKISMHICGSSPSFVTAEEIPADKREHELKLQTELTQKEEEEAIANGKKTTPANILEKKIHGRVNKRLSEYCLVDQEFFFDNSIKVSAALAQNNASVNKFVLVRVGEGIEKESVDFAAEVAAQVAAAQAK